jgi:hypothetical protein
VHTPSQVPRYSASPERFGASPDVATRSVRSGSIASLLERTPSGDIAGCIASRPYHELFTISDGFEDIQALLLVHCYRGPPAAAGMVGGHVNDQLIYPRILSNAVTVIETRPDIHTGAFAKPLMHDLRERPLRPMTSLHGGAEGRTIAPPQLF